MLPPEMEKDGGWGDLATKMEHNGGVVGFYLQKWRRIEWRFTSRNGAKLIRGGDFYSEMDLEERLGWEAFTSRNGAENQDTCLYSLSRLLQLLAHELILDASSSSPAQIELGSETGTRVQTLSFQDFF